MVKHRDQIGSPRNRVVAAHNVNIGAELRVDIIEIIFAVLIYKSGGKGREVTWHARHVG